MIVTFMGNRPVRTVALVAAAVALGVIGVSGTRAAARDDLPVWAPDVYGGYPSTHILVRLRPDLARVLAASHREDRLKSIHARRGQRRGGSSADGPPAAMSAMLRDTWTRWRATRIRPLFPGGFGDAALASRHGLDRVFVIEVPRGTDTPSMAAAFALHNAEVEEAGVDAIGGVAGCPNLPDDDRLPFQWNMHNIGQLVRGSPGLPDADVDAPEAWELHTGEVGEAVIASLDSGVDPHPEFADRMIPGQNVVPGADPNDTSDGCFTSGHGTHVIGIAAALGNNGTGVAGMTWGANILPVKVLTGCNGNVTDLTAGILWAAEWPCFDKDPCEDPRHVDVINMSLQYYGLGVLSISVLQNAINFAYDSGIVLAAATGNLGRPPIAFPAILNNVIAVGATTHEDTRAGLSNYGPETDVVAPGDNVYSTYRNGNYGYLSGTSMAPPHVSGLAALIRSLMPERTNDEIVDIILTSTDDLGAAGWDQFFGHGRINAYKALATALGGNVLPPCCGDGVVDTGEECDDGNTNNSDDCIDTCENAECGDGFTWNQGSGTEECDDGVNNSDTEPNACRTDCTTASCGDGVIDSGEECDDGNLDGGDLCSGQCLIEGACCDRGPGVGGLCAVTLQDDCVGIQLVWSRGASCAEAFCEEATGTCCNSDAGPLATQGICTGNVLQSDCDCETCTWTKGALCTNVDCPADVVSIPAVSEWGLVITTLLLLIGSKMVWRRRTT